MRLPLRLRLTLAFALGMVLVLSALGAFLYLRLGAELLRSIDSGLRSRAEVVVAGLGNGGGGFGDEAGALIDPDEAFAQVLDPSAPDLIVDSSQGVTGSPLVPAEQLRAISDPTFLNRRIQGLDDTARVLVVPAGDGAKRRFVVVGAILSDRHEALDRLLVLFAIGGPVALVLTSAAGWLLAGAALRPVERMRREAAAISASEPERRLPVPETGDELASLARTLNAMLERLQVSLGRERRFVDDASHELRTPLGILKAELDLALSRSRTLEEMEATLRRASAETNRLARLAQDLLVLSRTEGGHIPVHREDVVLRDVLEEACRDQRERARSARIELVVRASEERARLDPVRLRQAVVNLVDNSIRHVPAGGTILVQAGTKGRGVDVSVEDSGPGFPPEFLPRAFEPFARGEPPTAETQGAGLGLAIVRAVAESHGGSATVENLPGGGARVRLLLET
jgi:two-component system, OmpR family, sensor kinase